MNPTVAQFVAVHPNPAAEEQHALAHAVPAAQARSWNLRSITLIVSAWLILQIGGLFTPGLLDDVDSIYTEIAAGHFDVGAVLSYRDVRRVVGGFTFGRG